jgi:hypothetical protein
MTLLAGAGFLAGVADRPMSAQGAPARKAESPEFVQWRQEQLADATQLKKKLMALAGAVPAAKMGWRPMEGTRSFHDVFAHIAAEGFTEPTAFGKPLPAGSLADFDAEEGRLRAMPDKELIPAMERALNNLESTIGGLTEAGQAVPMTFYGSKTYPRSAVASALVDLHEHLGQLVSYARMNQIVPPWSRKS